MYTYFDRSKQQQKSCEEENRRISYKVRKRKNFLESEFIENGISFGKRIFILLKGAFNCDLIDKLVKETIKSKKGHWKSKVARKK